MVQIRSNLGPPSIPKNGLSSAKMDSTGVIRGQMGSLWVKPCSHVAGLVMELEAVLVEFVSFEIQILGLSYL